MQEMSQKEQKHAHTHTHKMTPYLSLRAPDVELGQRPCALTWKVNSISNTGNRAKGCKRHFHLEEISGTDQSTQIRILDRRTGK